MRLRPECKNGGFRPFQNWDMDIPHSIYPIIKIVVYNGINATWGRNISAQEGSRASIFALRSKSHGPLSESRVSRRSEKLKISTPPKKTKGVTLSFFFWFFFGIEILSFSDLLVTFSKVDLHNHTSEIRLFKMPIYIRKENIV